MAAIGTSPTKHRAAYSMVGVMAISEQLERLAATVAEVIIAVPDETSQDEFVSDEMWLMAATFWKD